MAHYSDKQIKKALKEYHKIGSVKRTTQKLGFPCEITLYQWLEKESMGYFSNPSVKEKPRHVVRLATNVKLDAIHRCFELGENVEKVANEIGCTRISIYNWKKVFLKKGITGLHGGRINKKNQDNLKERLQSGDVDALNEEIRSLQLEVAILKETINVLKKDPGVDTSALSNREKTVVVNALRNHFSLAALLKKMNLPRSVFYYNIKHMGDRENRDSRLILPIKESFANSRSTYGYRRIHQDLKDSGITISEKIVRRIMKTSELIVFRPKKKKYCSYQGEITPAVPNLLQRNFHSNHPNEKWLTDITEFSLSNGKLYLSPIIDCFDGKPICWSISENPDSKLVNGMLDKAIALLKDGEKPIIHSDRGKHYRWKSWIDKMKEAGLKRSMSRKGCSPDNSACEGFFGTIKNEMFYNRDWSNTTMDEFKTILDDYLKWFCEKRIKMRLDGMSPNDYRKSLNLD